MGLDHSLCFTAVSQFSPKWFWVDFSIGKLESHSVTIPLSGSSTSPVMRAYVGRNCSKRTFTWCMFLGQEAKEFYSCLGNVEKIKEGLETRKNKIFCQRVGRRSRRGITRIWLKGRWTELANSILSFLKWEHPEYFGFQSSSEDVYFLPFQAPWLTNKCSGETTERVLDWLLCSQVNTYLLKTSPSSCRKVWTSFCQPHLIVIWVNQHDLLKIRVNQAGSP